MTGFAFLPLAEKDGKGDQSTPDDEPGQLTGGKIIDLPKNKERANHGERNHCVIECGQGSGVAASRPLVPKEEAQP